MQGPEGDPRSSQKARPRNAGASQTGSDPRSWDPPSLACERPWWPLREPCARVSGLGLAPVGLRLPLAFTENLSVNCLGLPRARWPCRRSSALCRLTGPPQSTTWCLPGREPQKAPARPRAAWSLCLCSKGLCSWLRPLTARSVTSHSVYLSAPPDLGVGCSPPNPDAGQKHSAPGPQVLVLSDPSPSPGPSGSPTEAGSLARN